MNSRFVRGPFAIPPIQDGYPREALQGILVEAIILDRAGYAVFDWFDQAILCSVELIEGLDSEYSHDGWWATGDDIWSPWLTQVQKNCEPTIAAIPRPTI